jgi:small subunit ribosomal protein S11
MADEKQQPAAELENKETTAEKAPVAPEEITSAGDFDNEPEESVSSMMAIDEELPEEIKQKLEKNKQARAKKKMIKKKKKRVVKSVKSGRAYISATYNNTILSITDNQGDVISWASAGMAGFKGAKKATPYAAQIITKIAVQKAKEEFGLEEVRVFVSGVGTGREAAIRALNANGLNISSIKDTTPVPHNGCRPKKPRRV